jgi:large subunit ribosomal protein L21
MHYIKDLEAVMFAVIRTGGKQYKVAENDVILVEKLPGSAGAEIKLDDVLMIGGKALEIGAPALTKAAVFAEVLEQTRGAKVIVFKKKRRHNYRRKKGHRQDLTALRITGISATGAKPAKKAALKKTEPKKAAPEKTDEKKAEAKNDVAGKSAAKAPEKADRKTKE